MLTAITPIDGRYEEKTKSLSAYFSEFALIKYRLLVEIEYFKALVNMKKLPQLADFPKGKLRALKKIVEAFTIADAEKIKSIERTTNHDVKAVEYFLKDKFDDLGLSAYKEFIHFALTSQDVNNTATPLLTVRALYDVYFPAVDALRDLMIAKAEEWATIPMLARTHGQPATPTKLGKEIAVFVERLTAQLESLLQVELSAKFGGATGGFNAHYAAYPDVDWETFGDDFIKKAFDLPRHRTTTQIGHYDDIAALMHNLARINTILIDFSRDMWTYISIDYFKQNVKKGEVGSSTMPHKVNPIDFENAEGNLGIANAVANHLAEKLPISRLQRDLTDSTVLRNLGVPFAHTLIAIKSLIKGFEKLRVNEKRIHDDLDNNWMVITEGIQTILRRENYPEPYEALKALTRGKAKVGKKEIHAFIEGLDVSQRVKAELLALSPFNY